MNISVNTMRDAFRGYLPSELLEQQVDEFERERANIERDKDEAQKFIADQLPRDARILVIDVGQDGLKDAVLPEGVAKELQQTQFGGEEKMTYAAAFRHMLGLGAGDERLMVWRAFERKKPKNVPFPDAWLVTGGPAMPSEMEPGNETENTQWLLRAQAAIKELVKSKIPGVPVCLGHQLFNYSEGAKVGRLQGGKREFGTVEMQATDVGENLQLLYGFWDDKGNVNVGASHSEGVITPSQNPDMHVIAFNDYSKYQGFARPLNEGQTVEEADREDQLVLSLQNHPEITAMLLSVLRNLRTDAMRGEGLKPEEMLFRDTPKARSIWRNFIEMTARRAQKRQKSKK